MQPAIQQFNEYLQQLVDLDVDYQVDSSYRDVEKDLEEIVENYEEARPVLGRGRQPLQPPIYDLTIYYPISRRGELPPSPVTYRSPNPITPADLIESIGAVYRSPLSQQNIDAYIRIGPDYTDLNSPILRGKIMGGPKLRDVVGGHPAALIPYQNGYLLRLDR